MEHPESIYTSRSVGGRRKDLKDRYFRSAAEANYARWLNMQDIEWTYETKTFTFPVKRGTVSYTPDFYLVETDEWHEVKGWMDPKSITRLKRMKKYYPEVKVVVIGADWFKGVERDRMCQMVPNWECGHNR